MIPLPTQSGHNSLHEIFIMNAIAPILFILCFVYFALALLSIREHKSERGNALSPAWALHKDQYSELGQKYCAIGKPLFFIIWGAVLLWLISMFIEG